MRCIISTIIFAIIPFDNYYDNFFGALKRIDLVNMKHAYHNENYPPISHWEIQRQRIALTSIYFAFTIYQPFILVSFLDKIAFTFFNIFCMVHHLELSYWHPKYTLQSTPYQDLVYQADAYISAWIILRSTMGANLLKAMFFGLVGLGIFANFTKPLKLAGRWNLALIAHILQCGTWHLLIHFYAKQFTSSIFE